MTDHQFDELEKRVAAMERPRNSSDASTFATALTEALMDRASHEAGPIKRGLIEQARADLRRDPTIMQGAIQEALNACNLELKQKGTT